MDDPSILTNQELYDKIYDGITPKKENVLILVCAIVIASIGLNMNSQPVVIGAMLISPIMASVQGLGMGLATFDSRLTIKALKLLLLEAGFAIIAAAIYFFLSPITYASSEILARTQPTIWDAIIAIFGGIAGMIGARKKEMNNIVPGVAIATALMPPLCVVGYGIYERNLDYFLGASYLFLVNVSCIILTSFIVLQIFRISTRKVVKKGEEKKRNYAMILIAVLVLLPSIFSAGSLVKKQVDEQQVKKYVANEFSDYYVLNQDIDAENHQLSIDIIGSELTKSKITQLQKKLADYRLKNYQLSVRQVADSEALSLKDLDRYLENQQENTPEAKTQRLTNAASDHSLYQEMEQIKEKLFTDFPNRITSISLKEQETEKGEQAGVIEIITQKNLSETEQNKIKRQAESYIKQQEKEISIKLED
ncbi:MAG: TIGR00341 family protein [Enterococcus viikkiensis]|uniref:TIGR00341 family protein n=1 Tax=Enterococcus viikkiensis TaxID=930854 RepID=A0ABU3FPA3_9ENTE|nr:TIGR00341 family protein [Enterococcus viikkiensis]MDT2827789.1 TIGR00341 family protein [Enterococcus viikkiensis]